MPLDKEGAPCAGTAEPREVQTADSPVVIETTVTCVESPVSGLIDGPSIKAAFAMAASFTFASAFAESLARFFFAVSCSRSSFAVSSWAGVLRVGSQCV